MKNLKRTLAMLLALSLSAAATACGGNSSSESEGRTKSQDDVSIDTAEIRTSRDRPSTTWESTI